MKNVCASLVAFSILVLASCSTSTEIDATTATDADNLTAGAANTVDDPNAGDGAQTPTVTDAVSGTDGSPTPVPTDEPKPTTSDLDKVTDLVASTDLARDLSPEELRCVARGLLNDGALTPSLDDPDGLENLSTEDQTTVSIVTFDCAPKTVGAVFSTAIGDNAEVGPETRDCLVRTMQPGADNRAQIIAGFAALGGDRPVPPGAETPVVDTMMTCFPPDLFSDMIEAEMLNNPALATAVDVSCVEQRFGGEAIRPLWEILVHNPGVDFDQLDPGSTKPIYEAFFACMSVGTIAAAQAAESGVILSGDSIACIDAALAGFDIAALAAAQQDAEEIGIAMSACLSPHELSSLGG